MYVHVKSGRGYRGVKIMGRNLSSSDVQKLINVLIYILIVLGFLGIVIGEDNYIIEAGIFIFGGLAFILHLIKRELKEKEDIVSRK